MAFKIPPRKGPVSVFLPECDGDVTLTPLTARDVEKAAELAGTSKKGSQICMIYTAGASYKDEAGADVRLSLEEIETLPAGDYGLLLAASMGMGNAPLSEEK